MGLISFVQDAGRKVGLFGGRAAAEAEVAKEKAKAAMAAVQAITDERLRLIAAAAATAAELEAAILSYVPVKELVVQVVGAKAILTGTAASQADREKAVLVAGNTEGIGQVDDQLKVVVPEPPAVFHTVVKGDTLSAIAQKHYGVMRLYDQVFEANRPMLEHPDRIYPGQSLRLPPIQVAEHVVAKGETLGAIAKHWYGDAKRYTDLASANGLANPDAIAIGQKLKIPLSKPKVA